LKLFYDKPKIYSLPFQITVLASFKHIFSKIRRTKNVSNAINFVERSHLDGLEVFTPTLVDGGLMSEVEYDTLCYLAKCVLNENDNIDGYIYLKTDPDLCLERVKLRSRYEESPVCIEYIRTLHDKYEKWMSNLNSADVLVIDNNVDITSKQYSSYKKLVDEFCVQVCANKNKIAQQ
jgi:deoxycitidine kinase